MNPVDQLRDLGYTNNEITEMIEEEVDQS